MRQELLNVLRDGYEYLCKVLRKFRATLKIDFSQDKTCTLFVKRNLSYLASTLDYTNDL